jgi:hypothetical protein
MTGISFSLNQLPIPIEAQGVVLSNNMGNRVQETQKLLNQASDIVFSLRSETGVRPAKAFQAQEDSYRITHLFFSVLSFLSSFMPVKHAPILLNTQQGVVDLSFTGRNAVSPKTFAQSVAKWNDNQDHFTLDEQEKVDAIIRSAQRVEKSQYNEAINKIMGCAFFVFTGFLVVAGVCVDPIFLQLAVPTGLMAHLTYSFSSGEKLEQLKMIKNITNDIFDIRINLANKYPQVVLSN